MSARARHLWRRCTYLVLRRVRHLREMRRAVTKRLQRIAFRPPDDGVVSHSTKAFLFHGFCLYGHTPLYATLLFPSNHLLFS